MPDCYVADQIANYCNQEEAVECSECASSMTLENENGYELLVCDRCEHKIWADGDEYTEE